MKKKDIQEVLQKLDEQKAWKLTNEDDMEFDLECENGVCSVYEIDEHGDSIKLTNEKIVDVFIPFVFKCIDEIKWNEI